MDADAISGADDQGDGADAFHVVRNGAGNSWILAVPPEQPAAGVADLTEQLSDGSHWWERPSVRKPHGSHWWERPTITSGSHAASSGRGHAGRLPHARRCVTRNS
eukprot:7372117-Prymnesium_polylepis.1